MDRRVRILHRGKLATWKMKLGSYFQSLNENTFLPLEYGVKDEFNDWAKNIILPRISKHNNFMRGIVRLEKRCWTSYKIYIMEQNCIF